MRLTLIILAQIFKILSFQHVINIKIISERFYGFGRTKYLNSNVYFTLIAHLDLDARFFKIQCTPSKIVKWYLMKIYFTLLVLKFKL